MLCQRRVQFMSRRALGLGGLVSALTLWVSPPLVSVIAAEPDPNPVRVGEPVSQVEFLQPEFLQPEFLYGATILNIEVQAAPREDAAELVRLSGLGVNTPLTQLDAREAVKRLHRLGRFDNVYVYARPVEGGAEVRLLLPPRPRLVSVEVVEVDSIEDADLGDTLGLEIGQDISPNLLAELQTRLQDELTRRGYRGSAVGLALRTVDENGGRQLIGRIDPGPRTRLARLVVRGEPRLPLWQIGRIMGVKEGSPLNLVPLEETTEDLVKELRRRGYLEARARTPIVREKPDSSGFPRADLILDVYGGPLITLRIKGHRSIPRRELLRDLNVLYEQGVSPAALAEARERILTRYTRRGFWQARVEVATRRTPDGDKKEVLFSILEGVPGRVASLSFPGRKALPELALRVSTEQTVERALSGELGRPGANPSTVGDLFGDRSLETPRDSIPPSNTAPDPKIVYIPRAYRAARDAIGDLYRAAGYQTVRVDEPRVRQRERQPSLLDVEIPIQEGVRWQIGALSFSGNTSVPAPKLFELSGLDPGRKGGEAVSFDRIEEGRRRILKHFRDHGFLYATVVESLKPMPARGSFARWSFVDTSSATPLDVRGVCERAAERGDPSCDVELVFRIEEGQQVITRNVVLRHRGKTHRGILRSQIVVEEGELLSEEAMVRTRDNLLRMGIFDRVVVEPSNPQEFSVAKDVVVEVRERQTYAFDLGGGASTGEGVRVFTGFSDRNLFGTALRLQLQARLSYFLPPFLVLFNDEIRDAISDFFNEFTTFERLEYALAAGLSYPRIFGLPPGFSAGLDVTVLRDIDPAFAEDTQNVTLLANYKGFRPWLLGASRPIAVQLRGAYERSDLRCNEVIGRENVCTEPVGVPVPGQRLEETTNYLTAGSRVSIDLRDDPLDPGSGVYAEVRADYAGGLDEQSPSYVSLEGRASAYLPMAPRLTAATSLTIGKIFPLLGPEARDNISPNRRYFAGGRSTVRGYPERTLLPQDAEIEDGNPASTISSGGLAFFALQTELRISVYGPVALAFFWDVGDLYQDGNFSFRTGDRTLANGGGVGLRVATPVGPLVIDVGVPFNQRDETVTDIQLHFAVGTF